MSSDRKITLKKRENEKEKKYIKDTISWQGSEQLSTVTTIAATTTATLGAPSALAGRQCKSATNLFTIRQEIAFPYCLVWLDLICFLATCLHAFNAHRCPRLAWCLCVVCCRR